MAAVAEWHDQLTPPTHAPPGPNPGQGAPARNEPIRRTDLRPVTDPPDLAEFLRIIDGHSPADVDAVLDAVDATLAALGLDLSSITDDELLTEINRRLHQAPEPPQM